MKKIVILSLICLGAAQVCFSQDCSTQAAKKPSTYTKTANEVISASGIMSSTDLARMKPHLDKIENWIKNRLTNFLGAKLEYNNTYYPDYQNGGPISENLYEATGMKSSYGAKLRFFAYYCYDNNNKIFTEDESGSFIHVVLNNVFASLLCTETDVFTVNGKRVFKVLEKNHSEGRIDFYDMRVKSNVNDTIYTSKHEIILIRNSDKPVFINITRKEYLQQMLQDLEAYRIKRKEEISKIYTLQVKQFEDEVKIKKQYDKKYTAEKEATERKRFIEDNNPEKVNKDIKKTDSDIDGAKGVIIQYQGKPQDWLNRSFNSFYPYESYSAAGVSEYLDKLDVVAEKREDLTRTEIVYLNPDYFNNKQSVDVPQLISVHLSKKNYPHMLKVAKLIKQAGALDPLVAILNPGNSSSSQNLTVPLN
jgi:hypothetical protein